MDSNYHEEVKIKLTLLLRERLKDLPPFISEFFRAIADITSARTRLEYAYDLKVFFNFLSEECARFEHKPVTEFTIEDLIRVTSDDIEEFIEYLSYYVKSCASGTTEYQNEEPGKSRKLSALRTMFAYYYKKKKIPANPSELVDFPRAHEKVIVRLEVDEIVKLLDEVESGEHLTQAQKKYHSYTKSRDLALIMLLLGTGMRVSECVGLNIKHIDFSTNGARIVRKGGKEAIVYFGGEVSSALSLYISERERVTPLEGHEDALFLSMQHKRLTVRAIQKLVKKYTLLVTTLKKISPHKLRSTYGTQLYRESGDIYLVADVLGHADVNTTRKHYAQMDDERRRKAAGYVRLRED